MNIETSTVTKLKLTDVDRLDPITVFIEDYDFSDGIILTDDRPIMDFLHHNTLESTRGATINTLIPILLKEKIEMF